MRSPRARARAPTRAARAPGRARKDSTSEVLQAATLDLANTLDLEAVLERLLVELQRLVPYDTANVMLLDGPGRLVVRAVRGYERFGTSALVRNSVFDPRSHPLLRSFLESERGLLVSDAHAHPLWKHHPGAEHVRSFIGVPLRAEGQALGLYAVDAATPGFFTAAHVALTEALAPHAAIAIRNARLFEQLQRSEGRFRALVENSAESLTVLDAQGIIVFASLSTAASLGESMDHIIGHNIFERVHPDDLEYCNLLFGKVLEQPGLSLRAQVRLRHADGSYRVVEAIGVNRLPDPAVGGIVVNYRDVTERVRSYEQIEQLNRELQRRVSDFETLLDVIPIGIAIARDKECRHIAGNRYLSRIMGLPEGSNTSLSAPDDERSATVRFYRDGRPLEASELPVQQAVATGREVLDIEMDIVRDGEKVATVLGHAAPLFDEGGRPRGAIGTALDITERKRAEEQIRRLAYHDALTGLPNRRLFSDRLAVAVSQARRQGHKLAVVFLDLDRFKNINDSLGHSAGDRLIRRVAERLRDCVRDGDTVARLGGDEFTLLLPGVGLALDAAKVADKILESLRQPFPEEGRELFVTGSVGISLFPDDGDDAETLVKTADIAMYRAKEQGRDCYRLYAPEMNARALERLALESRLRKAVSEDELVMHYQPIVDFATGRVCALEALVRWRHPELGLLLPPVFIPLAEATGLILPIGTWALRRACAQIGAVRAAGQSGVGVAVNLSARQLEQPGLVALVQEALVAADLPPEALELEITESSAMMGAVAAALPLQALKDLGVGISIDDFGTGYSSLSHLKGLPLDTLKIDKSFVRDVTVDADDAAIVRAVIAMAHTLKLKVVAEGIETREQLDFLRRAGCDRGQGWLFGHPVPPEELARVLGQAPFI